MLVRTREAPRLADRGPRHHPKKSRWSLRVGPADTPGVMASGIEILPTPAGLAAAAAAVAVGAPLFADGLRTLRLSRAFSNLVLRSIADAPGGLSHVTGRVVLESPLFSPLSATPCAAFTLAISGQHGAVSSVASEARAFRLQDGAATARVQPAGARLEFAPGVTREVGPEDQLSENLTAILGRAPEAQWLRRTGGRLVLTEHVLGSGALCHAVGWLRRGRAGLLLEQEMLRTGTDDAVVTAAVNPALDEPDAWLDSGDAAPFLVLSDRSPERAWLAMPRWRSIGALAGPALGLSGLLYLAAAADRLRALGRL